MKIILFKVFILSFIIFLTSCGNEIFEIKDPKTGKLLLKYEYYEDENGQLIKDGEYLEWYADGSKKCELNYENDSLDGSCVYYDKDGSLRINNYHLGRLDGEQLIKSSKGTLISKENFENNRFHGKQEYFYPSGKLQRIGSYQSGKKIGDWKFFDRKGKLYFKLTFKNDICQQFIGDWVLEDARNTIFQFKNDGTFVFKAPYFKNFGEPVVQGQGVFLVENFLEMKDTSNGGLWKYEVFSVEKNMIILINHNANIEEAILSLVRI
jgi:antitoxin component YwqK of YwqJK toxin-antitoxin module